jgi:hypothetical protein
MKQLIILLLLVAIVVESYGQGIFIRRQKPVAISSIAYPLEQTATNAYAAYSFGRKLTNAWTSALHLMVRSSDGATNYFVTGDAAEIAALETWSGGGDVYTTNIFEQTGNGRTLAQGDTNLCPKVVTNGVAVTQNGHLVGDFDRGDYIRVTGIAPSLPFTFIVGVNNDTRTGNDVIFSGSTATRTAIKQGATSVYRIDSGGAAVDSTDALTLDTWQAVTAIFATGTDSLQVGAGTPVTGAAGDNTPTGLSIGIPTTGANQLISDIFVWNAAMPDADGAGPVRTNMVNFYAFP